jgi:hypothetical protein
MIRAMVAQLNAEGALFPVDAEGNELHPIIPSNLPHRNEAIVTVL